MRIKCFAFNKPFYLQKEKGWDEVPVEADTHVSPINIGEAECCLLTSALPFKDLITLYPSSPSEGRRGIAGANNHSLPSYQVKYYSSYYIQSNLLLHTKKNPLSIIISAKYLDWDISILPLKLNCIITIRRGGPNNK